MKTKRYFYFFLHVLFLSGLGYAFQNFITTPRTNLLDRRLWAYENWIILSFYVLFVWLTLMEKDVFPKRKNHLKVRWEEFRQKLTVYLILLIFPWGLFLLLAPTDILRMIRLGSVYWRLLGVASLIGAALYYLPIKNSQSKWVYYILLFGLADNLVSALIVTILFALRLIPLVAWSTAPLLFYFAWIFGEQVKRFHNSRSENNRMRQNQIS